MVTDSCFFNIWDKDDQITHAGIAADFGLPDTISYQWKIVDGTLTLDAEGETYDSVLERSSIPVVDLYTDEGVCAAICE